MHVHKEEEVSLKDLLYPPAENLVACELTEEEKEEALSLALLQKKEWMEKERKLTRHIQWDATLRRHWTPEEIELFLKYRAEKDGISFQIDDANREAVNAMCLYFAQDERFEALKDGYSLEKGLLLNGPVGTGKTTLMGLFRPNQVRCFKVVSCRFVADQYAEHGSEVLHQWAGPVPTAAGRDNFFQNSLGICFDDLGTEVMKKNFGNEANVMENILQNRYDKIGSMPFNYTHITTNLTAEMIEEFYGARVRSRMREMFNVIKIGGNDRRK